MLQYDDFYAQTRLKRRRARAVKRGFRLPSRVKLAKADKRVREKIAQLDTELARIEVQSVYVCVAMNSSFATYLSSSDTRLIPVNLFNYRF